MHIVCQASSEGTSEHVGHALGSAGVERENLRAYRRRIWIDGRRTRTLYTIQKTHLDRQALSESASEHTGKHFDTQASSESASDHKEEHVDRRASSKSTSEHIGNAFGWTGVEREHI